LERAVAEVMKAMANKRHTLPARPADKIRPAYAVGRVVILSRERPRRHPESRSDERIASPSKVVSNLEGKRSFRVATLAQDDRASFHESPSEACNLGIV
jgi:hypothetical protein